MKFSNFNTEATRTSFRHGNLYEVGSYVQNVEGAVGKVHRCGPNYVIAVTEEGDMFRAWVTDIKEYKQWNTSGADQSHRLVGTDNFRKLTQTMTPGSDYDMWKKPAEVQQRINKTKPIKEETMSANVRLSAWMLGLSFAEQQEIASKMDEIILSGEIIEGILESFNTERSQDLAIEYASIVSGEELSEGMKAARDNVGASTCWKGYKAQGTKKKGGKEVPNCVKEEEELEEKKKLDAVGKEDGDVDNDGDKDASDSYLMKRRANVTATINAKKGTKKESFSDWRTELLEKDVKGVEVNPSIEDNTDPMGTFDKNRKLKGAGKDVQRVKEECGCDKDDDGSEKALAKKDSKVKRVKYQDTVKESLRANIDELKSRYL